MINYEKFTLENGLRVLFHKDPKTPIATIKNDFKLEAKFLETFYENQEYYAWQFRMKQPKRQEFLRRSVAKWRVFPEPPHSN